MVYTHCKNRGKQLDNKMKPGALSAEENKEDPVDRGEPKEGPKRTTRRY